MYCILFCASCLKRGLSDELYCQLCKHLTANEIAWSEMKAWELLLICLFAVPVTSAFQSHLLNFISRQHDRYQSIHDRNDEERSIGALINKVYTTIVSTRFNVSYIEEVRSSKA